MPRIFISYRRDDSSASAGRIFDRLKSRFGDQCIFRDLDTIAPGAEFAKVIAEHIARCDVLIAVIGKNWLNARNADSHRRLDDTADFVKVEIGEALKLDKLVIPCLVEGTAMPKQSHLPSEIAAFAGRNAIEISETRFDYDVDRLIQAIDPQAARSSHHEPHAALSDEPRRFRPFLYIVPVTLIVTVLFLVFADIVLKWNNLDGDEISLITLIVFGVTVILSRIIARKKSYGKDT
jgi:hypothetical protein